MNDLIIGLAISFIVNFCMILWNTYLLFALVLPKQKKDKNHE